MHTSRYPGPIHIIIQPAMSALYCAILYNTPSFLCYYRYSSAFISMVPCERVVHGA